METTLKKKSKYKPVTTNHKKPKKTSSLWAWRFAVNGKMVDYPTFEREVRSHFGLLAARLPLYPGVLRCYTRVRNTEYEKFKIFLKDVLKGSSNENYGLTFSSDPAAMLVSFDFLNSEGKIDTASYLKVGQSGVTWKFDDIGLAVSYTDVKHPDQDYTDDEAMQVKQLIDKKIAEMAEKRKAAEAKKEDPLADAITEPITPNRETDVARAAEVDGATPDTGLKTFEAQSQEPPRGMSDDPSYDEAAMLPKE